MRVVERVRWYDNDECDSCSSKADPEHHVDILIYQARHKGDQLASGVSIFLRRDPSVHVVLTPEMARRAVERCSVVFWPSKSCESVNRL